MKPEADPEFSIDSLPSHVYVRLQNYVSMLDKWRRATSLISERAFIDVWTRHVADSICIQRSAPDARRWLDVGTGAGFPGVILASILADCGSTRVICVDADSKKCAFLREVGAQIALPIKIYNTRIELLEIGLTGEVDAITAKAFASLETTLKLTARYMLDGAIAILPRGRGYFDELNRIDLNCYTISVNTNLNHSDGALISVRMRRGSQ